MKEAIRINLTKLLRRERKRLEIQENNGEDSSIQEARVDGILMAIEEVEATDGENL